MSDPDLNPQPLPPERGAGTPQEAGNAGAPPQPGNASPQQPEHSAPQPGYGAQQAGYGAQQTGYGAQQQPGYGPPQTPGYGASRYGAPGYGAPAQPGYNVLAIVGFILAFFVNIVGIILGFVALAQIKRTGEQGHGLAIAAIVIGFAEIALGILLAIVFSVVFGAAVSHYRTY
jgi:peptidyl-prolyl cis-trans isomerase B (cyclophilin B)